MMPDTKLPPLTLETFKQLTSIEKKAYLTNPLLAELIFKQIRVDNIPIFTCLIQDKSLFPIETLPQYLVTIVPDLINSLVGSVYSMRYLFEGLPDEYCTLFCTHLGDQILNLFLGEQYSTHTFASFLYSLPLNHLAIFCNTVSLERIMADSMSFCDVMEKLRPEARLIVEEKMYPKLKNYHTNGYVYELTFKWLSPPTRTRLYLEIRDKIPGLIYDEDSFSSALEYLTRKQRKRIYKDLFPQLPNFLVMKGIFGSRTFAHLTPNQCVELLNAAEPNAITSDALCSMIYYLTTLPQVIAVLEHLKPRLISLFQEPGAHLFNIFDACHSKPWWVVLCISTKDIFPALIPSFEVFSRGLDQIKYADHDKKSSVICEGYLEQLPPLINSAHEFTYVANQLSSKALIKFCLLMQPKFAEILISPNDWEAVLNSLPNNKARKPVYEAMKIKWVEVLFWSNHSQFLPYFSPKQQEDLCSLVLFIQQEIDEKSGHPLVAAVMQENQEYRETEEVKTAQFQERLRQHSFFTAKSTKPPVEIAMRQAFMDIL